MKFKQLFLLGFIVFSLSNCGLTKRESDNDLVKNPCNTNPREYSIQAMEWQQNAAEYRALCYQAFNIARYRLDDMLKDEALKGKKLALITDIDETVMDNSPYGAKMIEMGKEYIPADWKVWVDMEDAQAIPGATEFLNYAKSVGVEIFYVSNRKDDEKAATLVNMKKIDFPFADEKHTLFKSDSDAKKSRFEQVEKEYHVLLFMGDNCSDFTSDFRAPSTSERNQLADKLKDDFGKKFIVLPNPTYGDWETRGIYQGKHNWTPAQKDSLRRSSLRSY